MNTGIWSKKIRPALTGVILLLLPLVITPHCQSTPKQPKEVRDLYERAEGHWRVNAEKTVLNDPVYQKANDEEKQKILYDWQAWRIVFTSAAIEISVMGDTETREWRALRKVGRMILGKWGTKTVRIEIVSENEIKMVDFVRAPLVLKREKGVFF